MLDSASFLITSLLHGILLFILCVKYFFNNKIETVSGVFNLYLCQISSSYSIFLLQSPVTSASASIKSDELSNQEEIMSDSVRFITKRGGKDKKTMRKKRNSHEETNSGEEKPVLSDENQVIYIAYFCVLIVLPSYEHNLSTLDFSITISRWYMLIYVCLCVYRRV